MEALWSLFAFIMAVLGVLFWVAVIVIAVKLIKRSNSGGSGPASTSALRILDERYARGEITREEFIERRSMLRDDAS